MKDKDQTPRNVAEVLHDRNIEYRYRPYQQVVLRFVGSPHQEMF